MANPSNRPIGIIGAMDVEIELLLKNMSANGAVQQAEYAGMTFNAGMLEGRDCVVVRCGIGMVNAAICAQLLVDKFDVSQIVNTGIAGSLDASIDIGDIVIATDSVNHIMDVQNLGYAAGQTPGFDSATFPASSSLGVAAEAAAAELGVHAHHGRVASGDRFVRSEEDKQRITTQFGASCCEMEGAAIAQTCFLNKVPYLIIRAISDKADGSAEVDYPTFEKKAAEDCANLTLRMLANANN